MIVPVNVPVATSGLPAAIDAAGNFSSTTLIHPANWAIVRLVGSTVGQNAVWTLAGDNGLPVDFANGPLASMGQVLVAPGQRMVLTINAATTFAVVDAQFVGLMSPSLEELLPHYTPSPNPLGATVRGAVSVVGGEGNFTDIIVTGLTGAQNQYRLVGSTLGGPPTAGTFTVGDWVVDRLWGISWTCITAGTPGTWRQSGAAIVSDQTVAAVASVRLPASGSLPTYFRNLTLKWGNARSGGVANSVILILRANDDAGANYDDQLIEGNGVTLTGASNPSTTAARVGTIPAANSGAGLVGNGQIRCSQYALAKRQSFIYECDRNDADLANGVDFGKVLYHPAVAAAVTAITLSEVGGSLSGTFTLYAD